MKPNIERFWKKVEKTKACWNWIGAQTKDGYGNLTYNKKTWRAHRFSWFLQYNENPILQVLHCCDNRLCVNPEHLFLGTNDDNIQDKIQKQRQRSGFKSTLTFIQVKKIRTLYKKGTSITHLALRYNVSKSSIWYIVNYKRRITQ